MWPICVQNIFININNAFDLKEKSILHIKKLDIKSGIKDVHPFLFNPEDSKRIELFYEYIRQPFKES